MMEKFREFSYCQKTNLLEAKKFKQGALLGLWERYKIADQLFTIRKQNLISGTPNDIKLNIGDKRYIRYEDTNRGDFGMNLENNVLYQTDRQNFFIFDSDHFNYPYLVYAVKENFISPPFRFIHIDAHIDVKRIFAEPPQFNLGFDDLTEKASVFFLEHLNESNFVTAIVASKLANKIDYITYQNGSFNSNFMFDEMGAGSIINHFDGDINFYSAQKLRLPRRFFNSIQPVVLAIDIDFFGISTKFGRSRNIFKNVTFFTSILKRIGGYSPEKIPVITIATSPGHNDGYKNGEEKIEVAKLLVKELVG